MGDVLQFPGRHAQAEAPLTAAERRVVDEFNTYAEQVIQNFGAPQVDPELISDRERQQMLNRLEALEQQADKPKGMGLLFWLSFGLIVL